MAALASEQNYLRKFLFLCCPDASGQVLVQYIIRFEGRYCFKSFKMAATVDILGVLALHSTGYF